MSFSSERTDKATKRSYNKRKHMRLPNGFGQISKVKGNLRNPYRAMVTVGKTPLGKPIVKMLKPKAYFRTYNEAYSALMKYHEDPFDLDQNMTCQELYDRWSEQHYQTIGNSAKNYKTAWKYCSDLYQKEVRDIRAKHIKYVIRKGSKSQEKCLSTVPSRTAQSNIKLIWNMMLD